MTHASTISHPKNWTQENFYSCSTPNRIANVCSTRKQKKKHAQPDKKMYLHAQPDEQCALNSMKHVRSAWKNTHAQPDKQCTLSPKNNVRSTLEKQSPLNPTKYLRSTPINMTRKLFGKHTCTKVPQLQWLRAPTRQKFFCQKEVQHDTPIVPRA